MDNTSTNVESQDFTNKSVSRRALVKAGWILPVIAVTPLMNTASAMSAVDCDDLLLQLDAARKNHDRAAYDTIRQKIKDNGCSY